MALSQAIAGRHAVRDYTAEPVDEATIRFLIAEAILAPSAINEQPWMFTVIREQSLLDHISQAAKTHLLETATPGVIPDGFRAMLENASYHLFYHAPALVVVSATMKGDWVVQDCTLAAATLMLAATAAHLGSCWIGSAQSYLATPQGRAALSLPEGCDPVVPVIIGHPKATTPPAPRRPAQIRWIG